MKELSQGLCAQGLSQVFRDNTGAAVRALEDFNLEVEQSGIVSLIGPSGCGKSSFLRLVAGLDKPQSGHLTYRGAEITAPHYERGFVFQDANLFPWLTVYENIAFGLRVRRVMARERSRVQEYIDLVGLTGFERAYPYELSGGMASRTALARTFIQEPGLILLDEPLTALDAFTRVGIQDEILKIRQRHEPIILLVTHDIEEAVYMSDRVVVLSPRPGHVVGEVKVGLPHPRDRTAAAFVELRREIMALLRF